MVEVHGSYDWLIVLLSVLVSIFASFTALSITSTESENKVLTALSLLGGALAMGLGLWAMHFIALLAFHLPIEVEVDPALTALSLLVAIIGSVSAFFISQFSKLQYRIGSAGIILTFAVVCMHYMGMAALEISGELQYKTFPFLFSVFVAAAASFTALAIFSSAKEKSMPKMVVCAVILGIGASGMHYSGMLATQFYADPSRIHKQYLEHSYLSPLAYYVTIASILILSIFLISSFVRHQQKLKKRLIQEQHYHSLFNHNPDLVCSIDVRGHVTVMNDTGRLLLQYEEEELNGEKFSALFTGPSQARVNYSLSKSLRGETFHYEAVIKRRNGSEIDVSITQMPITVAGNVHGVYVIAKDITEHKIIQNELSEVRQDLELTIRQQQGVIFKFVKKGDNFVYTLCDGQLMHKLGYRRENIVGRRLEDVFEEEIVEERKKHYEEAWSGKVSSYEGKKGGITFYVTLNPIIRSGQVVEVVGSGVEVSDFKRAQEQLRKSESLYRSVLAAMTEGLLFHDMHGSVRAANKSAAEILEVSYEDLLAVNPYTVEWEFTDADGKPLPREKLPSLYTIRTGKPLKNAIIGFRKNPSYELIWLSVNSQPLVQDEMLQGAVITYTDISKLVKQEKELRESTLRMMQAKEDAEKANRAKSEFLSKMSHELRTPLNSILGYTQILMDMTSEEQQDRLAKVLKAGNHLLHLINETLDLSKIDAGHLAINKEQVNVRELVSESIKLVAPMAEEHTIRMIESYESDFFGYIEADPVRLQQIILNLLTNAIKYSYPGNLVEIKLEHTESGDVMIIIKDEGIGIPEDQHELIFEPFYRHHKEKRDGTGIGLALVKQLVTLMDGKYGVMSKQGKGSLFWVSFRKVECKRLGQCEKDSMTVVMEKRNSTGKNFKILYIEDNEANIELMKEIFAVKEKLTLSVARTGLKGLMMVEHIRPDLILLDLDLPDMSGFEVFNTLSKEQKFCDIPVIAISANALPKDIQHALELGFKEYLTKPLNIQELRNITDQYLNEPALLSEAPPNR